MRYYLKPVLIVNLGNMNNYIYISHIIMMTGCSYLTLEKVISIQHEVKLNQNLYNTSKVQHR